jgi:putative DNA primase/helicase
MTASNVVKFPASEVRLSRATPHKSAQEFHAIHPTLIRYGEDWIEYSDGAYRMIADEMIESEVTKWLVTAKVRQRKQSAEDETVTVDEWVPFNPKPADANAVVTMLIRLYQVDRTAYEAPCFRTDLGDLGALAGVNPRNLISCQNWIVDITTRQRYRPTPAFLTFTALPINYDPEATCPTWATFNGEVYGGDKELERLDQQMFGLLISDDMSFQKIFYLKGMPRAGKGTKMRIMDALIGEQNIANHSIRDLAGGFGREGLLGKSLLKITDMNAGRDLDEAVSILNAISGEDPIHVTRKFKGPLDIKPRVRAVLAGNTSPDFGDHANAFSKRLKVLPYEQTFEGKEDRFLTAKLKAELPGILNYAIDGYADLQRHGFVESAASEAAKNAVLYSGNPVWGFVQEECILDPAATGLKDEVWNRYVSFCHAVGATPLHKDKFANKLMTAFPAIKASRPRDGEDRVQVFKGVRLRDDTRVRRGVPTITFRLDPFLLELGFDRSDPKAILRRDGEPVLYIEGFDDEDFGV